MSAPTLEYTRESVQTAVSTGRSRDSNPASMVFLFVLWFSLFFGVMVLLVLIVDTVITGSGRFDSTLITKYESTLFPERTGFRAGILGTLWLMVTTAVMTVPLGIAAALYLEEFADTTRWYNRMVELNLQNLAAVPSVVYGLLALATMALIGFDRNKGIVLGGAIALGLLILPIIIITTREAVRAVPSEIRFGSLALGATQWQTTWRQTLPSAIPGIATGTILGLSRAIGEAAPLLLLGIGAVRFDPTGILSPVSALPIQIFSMTSQSQEAYQTAAAAAIVVLLAMVLLLNGLAIFIRNKFQREW